jgi:hypothetical protein
MSDIRFNRWLHQSGTGGVYQDSSGRVGIGTSVPTSALDVQSGTIKIGNNTLSSSGVSTFSSGIVVSAGSTSVPSISPSGDSNTGIFFPSPDTIAFAEGGIEAARLDSSGNFGIGTANPSQKLEVVGGEIKAGRVDSTNEGGQVSFGRATDNATGWYIDVYGNTSTPSLRFVDVSNSAVRMTIDSAGRLTTPNQPAFLAYSTGVSVSGGWANLSSSLTTEAYDVGNNYGTSTAGRFVAPVAGKYFFYFGGWSTGNTIDARYAVGIKVNNNGSPDWISGGNYSTTDSPLSAYTIVVDLSVNDYVELFYFTAIANTWGGAAHRVYWGGYLL